MESITSSPARPKHAHLVGIGGINMSAVAKLLKRAGIGVSGSDAKKSELTDEVEAMGIPVAIGQDKMHVPPECDLLIYSSAVPATNPERMEAARRGIREMTNFRFLGEWYAASRVLLVTGTHGKSTTTAMLGHMLEGTHQDPTVIVGSRVPGYPLGNVRFSAEGAVPAGRQGSVSGGGDNNLVVIEGDEYAKHFLEFEPYGLIINNIELDHTDVFPDLDALLAAFSALLARVQAGGVVIANADDARVSTLIGRERTELESRGIRIRTFGFGSHADCRVEDLQVKDERLTFAYRDASLRPIRVELPVPGRMNALNAAAALTLASSLGIPSTEAVRTLESYRGIWRRFEIASDRDDVIVVSDYAHHPTAVAMTLDAARSFYPGRRLLVCFQPHHRRRTRDLFDDFIPAFDKADHLALCEIYDVAGREEGDRISSRDLQEAIIRHDGDRGVQRSVEYASDPEEALTILKRWKRPGDIILVMGAGDIYSIAKKV
ncbi:MAG: UDP-N-acetylmuramate--L-alanine ligase [Candidatus Uhrbacteria bacterium]|nr:UDP-N-acetylmuramate--L-alanine ligase [Candidatus Uhrbacteria bacterium]